MARKRASAPQDRSYSMPELCELYGRPPFHYRETEQIVVAFKTAPGVLQRLVPAPLVANHDDTLFLTIAEFLCSGFGHYLEMHLFTHATYKRRLVNYSLYLILDNDVATGAGREIWGFPKKMGRLTLDMTDDVVRGTVERGGITVCDAAVRLARMADAQELGGTAEWVARKTIPNVSLAAPPDVDQLTSTTLTDIEVGEIHAGPATLSFAASPADQLSTVPIHEVTGGYYFRSTLVLPDGEVLHDYLA